MTYDIEAHLTALNERDNDQARGSGVIASAFSQIRDVECERDMLRAKTVRMQARLDEASDILAAVQDHFQNCDEMDLVYWIDDWLLDGNPRPADPSDDVSNDPESAR